MRMDAKVKLSGNDEIGEEEWPVSGLLAGDSNNEEGAAFALGLFIVKAIEMLGDGGAAEFDVHVAIDPTDSDDDQAPLDPKEIVICELSVSNPACRRRGV